MSVSEVGILNPDTVRQGDAYFAAFGDLKTMVQGFGAGQVYAWAGAFLGIAVLGAFTILLWKRLKGDS